MFCCGPKLQTSSGSGTSNSSLNSNNHSGHISLVQHSNSLRSLPARIPEMDKAPKKHMGKKCLALDLDETLVHSSFQVHD
jgi:TFIIF-interacting CTD phosphatase-like protein